MPTPSDRCIGMEQMLNAVCIKHRKITSICTGFVAWDSSTKQQRGAAWREQVHCIPSTSSMQHCVHVVPEIIEEYNEKDLAQLRKLLEEINILRDDNPNIINMQADRMYTNPVYSRIVYQLLIVHTTC
ncbi:Hypothetical predicted protein [Mytilus galloprovincialis]|uniref:Uncharacterized protein n=1 Tax=Mytilus galloprovincialis TaxID=29158 RepID=A0A8B6GPG8_MYTGA|nr:Hypothetical predicted protein [Mytilus galloprovincialis]